MPVEPVIQHVPLDQEYWFREGCHILELSNTPADAAVSIARARVTSGQRTRWHRLVATTERYVILEGEGSVEVGDLPPQTVAPGSMVIIPPHYRQRITNTGGSDLIFLAICSPRFLPENYQDCEEGVVV